MNGNSALLRTARPALLLGLGAFCASAAASSSYRTNWVERTITNQIEIRMPRNVFVNEYQTNWVDVVRTNVVRVRETNQITRWVTNEQAILGTHTNYIDRYRTNWSTRKETHWVPIERFRTNFVDAYRTNWTTHFLTNDLSVNAVRTNFVKQYRTNWQVLTVTNWQTVIVMRTNWINQPITNVVQIDLPAQPSAAARAVPRPANPKPSAPAVGASAAQALSDDPVIEGARTSLPAKDNKAEVRLQVRWPKDIADPLPVQNWKIESEDGAFLGFGQDQVLTRELPVGTYRIEANLYREVDNAALILHGRLVLTPRSAAVQPVTTGKRVATTAPF
jgi:hypothetical protein